MQQDDCSVSETNRGIHVWRNRRNKSCKEFIINIEPSHYVAVYSNFQSVFCIKYYSQRTSSLYLLVAVFNLTRNQQLFTQLFVVYCVITEVILSQIYSVLMLLCLIQSLGGSCVVISVQRGVAKLVWVPRGHTLHRELKFFFFADSGSPEARFQFPGG